MRTSTALLGDIVLTGVLVEVAHRFDAGLMFAVLDGAWLLLIIIAAHLFAPKPTFKTFGRSGTRERLGRPEKFLQITALTVRVPLMFWLELTTLAVFAAASLSDRPPLVLGAAWMLWLIGFPVVTSPIWGALTNKNERANWRSHLKWGQVKSFDAFAGRSIARRFMLRGAPAAGHIGGRGGFATVLSAERYQRRVGWKLRVVAAENMSLIELLIDVPKARMERAMRCRPGGAHISLDRDRADRGTAIFHYREDVLPVPAYQLGKRLGI